MPRPVLHNVQTLRFIAAFAVVFSHMATTLFPLVPENRWIRVVPWTGGVDLFFVISGFIMVLLSNDQFGQRGAATAFLKRRIIRIVPPYWFFTTLTIIVVLAIGGRVGRTIVDPIQAMTSYAFLPWLGVDGEFKPIVGQGWTLNYEAFFYAAFAVALLSRRGLAALCAFFVLLALAHPFVPRTWFMLDFWSQPTILEFVAGMALGKIYLRGRRLSRVMSVAFVILAIGAFVATHQMHVEMLGRAWSRGIPATVLAAAFLLAPEPKSLGPIGRLVQRGGDASYTIYLAHYLIINAVGRGWAKAGLGAPWIGVAIGVIVALAVSIIFFERVERPVTAALQRRFAPRRPSALDEVAP